MDRRFQIIAGAIAGILVGVIAFFALGGFGSPNEATTPTETTISTPAPGTTGATTPDIPDIPDDPDPSGPAVTDPSEPAVSIPGDDILTPGEGEEPDPTDPEATEPKDEAEKPDTPVVEDPVIPTDPEETEPGGEEDVGGETEAPPYDCGDPNHHCANEYAHAMVANRELEGCEMCGSHSCPSFYAVDEWGQGTYDPSLCPEYDVHDDPVHYCQACGKPTGDGTNGTCVFFVVDTQCPHCGKDVDAWECHSCK